jgi:uncharacterized iron-regulated membrane protein
MRLLSLVHRWTGGLIGLLVALLGLSGAILVWEGSWVGVPGASDPLAERAEAIAAITANAAADGRLSRVTFASDEIGLHLLTYADGGGAYVRQDGAVIDRWGSQWERPELWLFDLHHHLFAGHTGETVTGIAGVISLLFVVTGLILWWRSRRSFAPSLLPKRFAPGPIVKHHRDLGVIVSPLLLISLVTGVMMLFEPVRVAVLGAEERPKTEAGAVASVGPSEAILRAKAMFPDGRLRRLSLPADPGGAIVVRLRQPFEWTPNGRTQVTFEADGAVHVENPAAANRSAWLSEKLYPVHSAKVGGLAMKLLMTLSGLGLFTLGSFATYSFWVRRSGKRRARSRRDMHLYSCANG